MQNKVNTERDHNRDTKRIQNNNISTQHMMNGLKVMHGNISRMC